MPSSDEQVIEENRTNSILDLQLYGIQLKLHERPELGYCRPSSRSEYLTRPMSAIPLYYKKSSGGVRERPRSAGAGQGLRHRRVNTQFPSPRTLSTPSSHPLIGKGSCSRSELSLNRCPMSGSGRRRGRGGGVLEPGLASKPPLPPPRPAHTQSLDDIVNIKFLRWFPESAEQGEKEGEWADEAVVGCDSSLGNDETSELGSCDSRLGFTSPDIALDTEGNLRPPPPPPSPPRFTFTSPDSLDHRLKPDDYFLHSYHPQTPPVDKMARGDAERSGLSEDGVKKNDSNLCRSEGESPSPVFTRRTDLLNSASEPSSRESARKSVSNSRSVSLDSADSNCNSVIENRLDSIDGGAKYVGSSDSGKYRRTPARERSRGQQLERNLRFGGTTMFDSNDSLYETEAGRRGSESTPEMTPEPVVTPARGKFQRGKAPSSASYRVCTPDSLTTPEPSPTPEPLPSASTPGSYRRRDSSGSQEKTLPAAPSPDAVYLHHTKESTSDNKHHLPVTMATVDKVSRDSGAEVSDYEPPTVSPTPLTDHKEEGVECERKAVTQDRGGVEEEVCSTSRQQPSQLDIAVSKHDQILSWMGTSLQGKVDGGEVTSTYDDLVSMIKAIEHDEVESIKLEVLSGGRSTNNSACSNNTAPTPTPTPTGHATRDILGLLEGVEEASRSSESRPGRAEWDEERSVALAERCMALSDKLESERRLNKDTAQELSSVKEQLAKLKSEYQTAAQRHRDFVNQLLKEKRALGEQCAALVKEIEAKHRKALKMVEERQAVELKKQEERLSAAEKIRREKWIDSKTKKIKEMTVCGVESELNRLSGAHQEELKELRRLHDEEVNRVESVWRSRLSQAREEAARQRESAVLQERQAAATNLQAEIGRLEADQREARRILLQELREERQKAELQMERTLSERQASLDSKYQQALAKLDEKLAEVERQHKEEVKRLREGLESERESWLEHQTRALADKERELRAEAKRERDRHIEAAIRKLDQEAQHKQQQLENKTARLKESWEEERKDLESEIKEMKRKVKEVRREVEEAVSSAESVKSRAREEVESAERRVAEMRSRLAESSAADTQRAARLADLETQLASARTLHQQALADKQSQLDILYNRVKEAVTKKDEQIRTLQKERDSAIDRCNQLEAIMERRTAID